MKDPPIRVSESKGPIAHTRLFEGALDLMPAPVD